MQTPSALFKPAGRPEAAGLIFDMDGTILDTRSFHMDAWRELVKKMGLSQRHYEVAENAFGQTNWAIFDAWFAGETHNYDFDELSQEKEILFRQLIKGHAQARPGFNDLIRQARALDLRIGLATSGPRENAEFLLEELGVIDQFDAVVFGHAQVRSKPHPDSFLTAAARMQADPRACIGFEDSIFGFWSVLRAGMRLVGIAEREQDAGLAGRWSPWPCRDFVPVVELLRREYGLA